MPGYAAGALAVLQRDAVLYFSYRMRLVTQMLSVFFSIALFYYISRLVTIDSFGSPDGYFEFVVVGLVIMQTITGTLAILPVAIRQELVAGTFESLVLSPFGAVAGVLTMVIFPFLRAVVMGIVMLIFAVLVFGLELEWPIGLLSLPAAALGALAFTPFALLFTAAVLAFKQAPGAGFVLALISLVAGVYFPVELLPGWVQWTSEIQPFTPTIDLMRHLLVGTELQESAWLEVAKLTGFAVVLVPVSLLALAAALNFGQRRGTVTEY